MKELRFKVSEFASLIGCSMKTVYKLIENNQLNTVNELQNGRSISFVVTNDNEIQEFQKNYGKIPVNESECNDILTVNNQQENKNNVNNYSNSSILSDVFDKILEVNNQYNERIERVNEELITYKSKQLLLEDKASREGLYLQEINQLKASKDRLIKWLITIVIIFSLMLITVICLLVYNTYKVSDKVSVQVSEQVKEKTVK